MKLAVIIPTYRRPKDLDRCLRALAEQERKADQVIVVRRTTDDESAAVVHSWNEQLPLKSCLIAISGVAQALNLALQHVTGDIITVTDDDACAMPDWLARVEAHFQSDPGLGGLGGRDLVHDEEDGHILPATTNQVGLILPFGKLVGNHHCGRGAAREVDHLKGVNMSWRATAIHGLKFESDLRGAGAQVYFELAFSLEVQRRGWRIVYDPAVQVHHFVGRRFDSDDRTKNDLRAAENAAFNLFIVLLRSMQPGMRRNAALLWARNIGAFGQPGRLRGLWFRITGNQRGVDLSAVTARAWREAQIQCAAERVNA
jgi:glycosyltransferase involved in cell wall biosynthesis